MRAWLADFGGGVDSLRRVELPEPEPRKGEVLIQLEFATLNRRDQSILDGYYPLPVKPTLVPACDAVGTILATGPGVAELHVGERVVLAVFPAWEDGPFSLGVAAQLGGSLDGVLRERLCWPASAVVRVPEGMDPLQAACLPCAAVTAWNALDLLELRVGQSLLSTTTGNVSVYAVQFAATRGLIPHLLSNSTQRISELERAGISAEPGAPADGADGAVHTFGSIDSTVDRLAFAGRIALVSPAGGTPIDAVKLFSRNVTVRAVSLGTVTQTRRVIESAARNRIHMPIIETFDFDDVPRAFTCQAAGTRPGKVAIMFPGEAADS
ncbi:alcohol dehydrogenase catalytic domain-containing protein [Gryllotalpicola koreensis]|uniref:NAD(P)-dependent alcohol dehydrogenase n=1 Tax=Gryllotalpicola koreensis TaxID=993086 RepID=A0ABP7ZSC9_9MICO